MVKSPAVSVALATFNGARHIAEQLESIRTQTLQPSELVVCDDGSTDETLQNVRSFGERVPFPVHVHRQSEQLGYRRNFRSAAALCSGELIAFCDQDDVWHANKLQRLASAFHDPTVLLAYHDANVVDASGTFLHRKLDGRAEKAELSAGFLGWKSSYGLLQMFRATLRRFDPLWDLSIDHNDRSEILAHDQWYFFLAGVLGRIEFIDEPLVEYRQHGSNLYGAPKSRGLLSRLHHRFVHFGGPDAELALAARARARICGEIARREPGQRASLARHEAAYLRLAERLQRRHNTYASPSLRGRLASLARGILNGDYQGKPRGFEPASVVRDAWSGVFRHQIHDPGVRLPPVRTPPA
ncbi:glycosyltransferase family 2 protein [Sphingomonas arenae]|uniref:glycosyltransferase family 2 protein n=1 Tax=Sphingomonas arenae TaxID=2812555 RepID=UPI001968506A|nr:glycosyltransferase family 2 protein [Sphingomonas arenae]